MNNNNNNNNNNNKEFRAGETLRVSCCELASKSEKVFVEICLIQLQLYNHNHAFCRLFSFFINSVFS